MEARGGSALDHAVAGDIVKPGCGGLALDRVVAGGIVHANVPYICESLCGSYWNGCPEIAWARQRGFDMYAWPSTDAMAAAARIADFMVEGRGESLLMRD